MNLAAVFHRPMSEYAFAMDENTYVFRLRAQRGDLKRCTLHYADRAAMTPELDFQRVEMPLWRSDKLYDWFEVTLKCPFERIAYHFELDDDSEIEIRPEDIEMQACRSSGAGGQHINKTSSAVRLIHKATGIVVSCQTERSQFQNKETCLKMLRSKLVEIKEREHLDKISDIKGVQQKIEWGSQIRNYVFMPYTLVKDTRTGCETSNVNAVMDGALDPFIESYLNCLATGNWVQK